MAQHIKDNLSHLFTAEDDCKMQLLSNWDAIMGTLSDKVRLEKIQDDTLILGVYDSSWMQELFLLSRVLIQTINKHLTKPFVKEIRFKAAAQKKRIESHKKYHANVQINKKEIILSQEQILALEKVTDDQLRSELREYLIRCQD